MPELLQYGEQPRRTTGGPTLHRSPDRNNTVQGSPEHRNTDRARVAWVHYDRLGSCGGGALQASGHHTGEAYASTT